MWEYAHNDRGDRALADRLLAERRERATRINVICAEYSAAVAPGDTPAPELAERLRTMFGIPEGHPRERILSFALDAFRERGPRKHGSPFAAHSLEIHEKARALGLDDPDLLATVLLHDVVEDTSRTNDDIATLDMELGTSELPYIQVMTEERSEDTDRDANLVRFVQKLAAAPGVAPDRQWVIHATEVLDRIDDLSNLEYLTDALDDPARRDGALASLAKKLGKCRYTVDRVAGNSHDPRVADLRRAFSAVADLVSETYGVSADAVAQAYDTYVGKEQGA